MVGDFVGDFVGDISGGLLRVAMLKNSMRLGISLATEKRKRGANNHSDKARKTQNMSRMIYEYSTENRKHKE